MVKIRKMIKTFFFICPSFFLANMRKNNLTSTQKENLLITYIIWTYQNNHLLRILLAHGNKRNNTESFFMCPQKTTIKQQMEPFSIVEKSTAKVTFPKCFLCLLWGSKYEDFIEKLYVNQIFHYYSNIIKKINKMQNKTLDKKY